MLELQVDLGERSYPIFIGPGLLGNPDFLLPYIRGRQVAIVTDQIVSPLFLERIEALLEEYDVVSEVLPTGEPWKSLTTVERIFDTLLRARFTRKATLVALGGGVVGDMTGFAAACYQRGIDFIQVPTTLLSQVDSSVGGKTGVNHPLGKNMIGAFHQPNAVIIDIETLSTLPDRELSAGLAEVIKYGLIKDKPFYHWLQEHMDDLLARKPDTLAYAIHRSCENKARVVAADERESGVRAILNLGHTFGHAIETCLGYGGWLHGEAVAAGMVMAADLSVRLGMITQEEANSIHALLLKASLPVHPPEGMTPEQFMDVMTVDKKVLDGKLRLVLLKEIGKAIVTDSLDHERLAHCLSSLCRV
ncbi:3-dehydroquinate synthase [Candidatus Sororendozoicomonas aggregata]|uniref:3-dehydroquinate synthase n=1 Tax=Candidatus Sororendozoicomonas aggregata TaxID=3073239 RepID=UPI002ED19FF1